MKRKEGNAPAKERETDLKKKENSKLTQHLIDCTHKPKYKGKKQFNLNRTKEQNRRVGQWPQID